jgi:diguanylate cyclase
MSSAKLSRVDSSADEKRLAAIMTWIATAIALFVTFAAPVSYYALSRNTELKESAIAARLHASFITFAIGVAQSDLLVQAKGLIQTDLAPSSLPEARFLQRVDGLIIDQTGPSISGSLAITSRAEILSAEGAVGSVIVMRSMMPIFLQSLLVLLGAALLGCAIYGSLKVMPLKALNRTLDRLKRTEAKGREEAEENLRIVFKGAVDGILMLTPSGEILSGNPSVTRMLGYLESDLIGTRFSSYFKAESGSRRIHDRPSIANSNLNGVVPLSAEKYESVIVCKDGRELPVEVTTSASNSMGKEQRIAIVRDITERQQAQSRLKHMANYDSLTGLPNRSLFRERLQLAIEKSDVTDELCAIMFLDLDRFKTINDSLGHEFGDRLLIEVAKTLTDCLRDSDSIARNLYETGDLGVYRLGGDEFTILIEGLKSSVDAAIVAKRILERLAQPFQIGLHQLFISVSIGITLYPQENTDIDALVKQADLAMYRSKSMGRDTFTFFSDDLAEFVSAQHVLETSLRHALEHQEFRLVYQPKANVATGAITGIEALIRWDRSDGTTVVPDKFIPLLEETGLIVPVGMWVIREACEQLMRWRQQGITGLTMAVNLSARQFRQEDLVSQIARVIEETGIPDGSLEVELTESSLIDDSETVVRIMTGLAQLHVSVAIDDFGTGHSSLRYLKRFDVDTLKIDRSFVRDIPEDAEDRAIALAVIALGHGMSLKVVAEGVETEAQLEFLRASGCDEMQGYLLSAPMHSNDFAAWFNERLRFEPKANERFSQGLSH